MATIPPDYYADAIAITCGFEVSGDPYLGVSGNFDGMGISCGCLQWNIGAGSLQPLVKAIPAAVILAKMPKYGADLIKACTSTVSQGLAIVNAWQNNKVLPAAARSELRAMLGTPEMRAEQDKHIAHDANLAFDYATAWLQAGGGHGVPEKRLYCWFFDIVTQNGSLAPVTYAKVSDFIKLNTPGHADDVVCDYLAAATGTDGFIKDAHKNSGLWRNQAAGGKLELLCGSYLRAQTARLKYRPLVLNRKGAIAMGKGWVNGALADFSKYGL